MITSIHAINRCMKISLRYLKLNAMACFTDTNCLLQRVVDITRLDYCNSLTGRHGASDHDCLQTELCMTDDLLIAINCADEIPILLAILRY